MATTTDRTLVIYLAFEDTDQTRRISISGIGEEVSGAQIKQRIKTINADVPANFKKTFISDQYDELKRIVLEESYFVVTEEEVLQYG